MHPDEYCQQRAAARGSSTYYSLLFVPDDRRRAITALHAFHREVADIASEVSEREAAHMKLAWWRAEIGRLYAGQPNHPVARALAPVVEDFVLESAAFEELIAGVEMDVDHGGYATFEELERYCHRAGSVVGPVAARVAGYDDPRTDDSARDLGIAFRLTDILREARADAMRGRVYIPRDELDAHGVKPGELAQARTPDNVRALLREQAERARAYYRRAFESLPEVDRHPQRSAIILARINLALLDEIERDGFRVLDHRVALTPVRKLWIAWRTARAEERRRPARSGT